MCEVCGDPMHKLDDDTETAMPRRRANDEIPEPLSVDDHTGP